MSTTAVLTLLNHITVLVLGEENMPIQVVQGSTGPAWSLTFKTADNAAFDLTGAAYTSAVLYDPLAVGTGNGLTVTGVFATVSAAAGTATFSPAAGDTAARGLFTFEIKITKGGLVHYFRCPVEIVERYAA